MTDQSLEKHVYCTEQISLAHCTIHSSLQIIKFIFKNREYSEIYYYNNDVKELLVEVQLDCTVLVCSFDKNNICTSSILFFDNPADLLVYTQCCSQLLNYDHILSGWIMKDCYITKTGRQGAPGLSVKPAKPEFTTEIHNLPKTDITNNSAIQASEN